MCLFGAARSGGAGGGRILTLSLGRSCWMLYTYVCGVEENEEGNFHYVVSHIRAEKGKIDDFQLLFLGGY